MQDGAIKFMDFYEKQRKNPETAPPPIISMNERQSKRTRGKPNDAPATVQPPNGGRQRALSVGDSPRYLTDPDQNQQYQPPPGPPFLPNPPQHQDYEPVAETDSSRTLTESPTGAINSVAFPTDRKYGGS